MANKKKTPIGRLLFKPGPTAAGDTIVLVYFQTDTKRGTPLCIGGDLRVPEELWTSFAKAISTLEVPSLNIEVSDDPVFRPGGGVKI